MHTKLEPRPILFIHELTYAQSFFRGHTQFIGCEKTNLNFFYDKQYWRTVKIQIYDSVTHVSMQCTLKWLHPSSTYSCSIGHIWEHEFCHLGCWAVKEKSLKRWNFCLSKQLFELVFSTFYCQKKLKFFKKIFLTLKT